MFFPPTYIYPPAFRFPLTDTPQVHALAHRLAAMDDRAHVNERHLAFARKWCEVYERMTSWKIMKIVVIERLATLLARYKGQGTFFRVEVTEEDLEFATEWVRENPVPGYE